MEKRVLKTEIRYTLVFLLNTYYNEEEFVISGISVPVRNMYLTLMCGSDVWLTVHRNSVWVRKTNKMSLFVFFISLLIVAQHVSGNHVPIIRS